MNECVARDGRKEKRRDAIMKAAYELFLEEGYSTVSMTEIIRRSGGSLATAYALFESKQGLLRALIEQRTAMFHQAIEYTAVTSGPPEKALKKAARQFMDIMLEPGTIAMLRIIVTESQNDAYFRESFKTRSSDSSSIILSRAFQRWHDDGLLDVDNPVQAAETFFALLLHKIQMAALCCVDVSMTDADLESHIDHAIRMIWCRYGKTPRPGG
mgnify:CR=1 FL=1